MTPDRHSLLTRQIRRLPGGAAAVPESLGGLLASIDAAYRESDADRAMLERSLELSSRELVGANAELRALLVAFPDLVFRTDADGRILECRGGRSIDFHLAPAQLYGKRIQDLPGTEARAKFREALERIRTAGQASTIEYSLTLHEEAAHYEARLVPLAQGHTLVVVRNISERRRAQAELQHSLSLVRATLESTADGLLVMDRDGRIIDFNHRFVEMWGIPDDLIATRDHARVLAFVRDQLSDPSMLQCQTCDAPVEYEIESVDPLQLKDGRFFERYTRPQRVGSTCVGRVCSFRDVTASRCAAEAMLQAKDAAEDANRIKGNFLANVSHELRTPITGLLAIADFLLQSNPPMAERDLLVMLQSCATALATVVNDMLDFSRIKTGTIELRQEPFGLGGIAQEIVDLMGATAHAKGIALACHLPPDLPERLLGDPVRVRQTLMNLVGNAVKFTDRGSVVVEIEVVREKADALDARIVVRDTGIGIPDDLSASIFESFVQVDGSSTRVHGGTGLGLSIAKRLTEMMGGRIGLESHLGVGSSFWIELSFQKCESDTGETTQLAA